MQSIANEKSQGRNRPPFMQVPLILHEALAAHVINMTEYCVYEALLFRARNKPHAWPSTKTVGKQIGRSEGVIRDAIHRLAELGFIRHAGCQESGVNIWEVLVRVDKVRGVIIPQHIQDLVGKGKAESSLENCCDADAKEKPFDENIFANEQTKDLEKSPGAENDDASSENESGW
jgi:hypothetical protein